MKKKIKNYLYIVISLVLVATNVSVFAVTSSAKATSSKKEVSIDTPTPNKLSTLDDEDEPSSKPVIVYRLYNPNSGEHLFTAKFGEYMNLIPHGWKTEGADFDAYEMNVEGSIPVYRVFDPNTKNGNHLYTTSLEEAGQLVEESNWLWDFGGNPAYYATGKFALVKFHQNSTNKDFYTANPSEVARLEKLRDYKKEGTLCNVPGYYADVTHYQ